MGLKVIAANCHHTASLGCGGGLFELAIVMNRRRVYRRVCFERESYANEGKAFYPVWWREFEWMAYLRCSSFAP